MLIFVVFFDEKTLSKCHQWYGYWSTSFFLIRKTRDYEDDQGKDWAKEEVINFTICRSFFWGGGCCWGGPVIIIDQEDQERVHRGP